ncbi:MAG: amidohydrolase family protein [Clostridia bacterium]|nr:amidohydrolase family protein [Clostridia bacterium]
MINVRGKDMMLIEAHCHVWTKIHGRRLDTCSVTPLGCGRVAIGEEEIQFMPPEWENCCCSIEVLQTYEKLLGFDKAVILQTPCYGEQYDYINSVIAKQPDRYATVGIPNPQDKASYIETAKLCLGEYGYKGLKFEAPDIPFDMVDPKNAFVFEEIMKYNAYFMMDLGWGDGPYDFPVEDLLTVAKRYPELKIVLPHLGISRMWDPKEHKNYESLKKTLSILELNQNVWFDMSGIPMMVDAFDEYPYPTIANVLREVKKLGAIDRVMWGTDMPTVLKTSTYLQNLTMVTKHCDFLTDDEMENLLGKTAQKVWFE